MAKAKQSDAAAPTAANTSTSSALEDIATRLDKIAEEAKALGEEPLHKTITAAAKRARNADKRQATKYKRFGKIIEGLKTKGLSDSDIVAYLSGNGNGGQEGGAE